MKYFSSPLILTAIILLLGCRQTPDAGNREAQEAIMAVLNNQVSAWNEGSIEKYMEGYDHSDSLRFASGGTVSYGWEATLERYKNGYSDRDAMGILIFSDIDITVISQDAAYVFGEWELQEVNENPWGLFTLVLRKRVDGWRIVHDHTSSAE